MISRLKRIIKRYIRAIRTWRELGVDERIDNLDDRLHYLESNYSELEVLGGGKDGRVYRGTRGGKSFIIKIISRFGRRYLPVSRDILGRNIPHPAMVNVDIIDDTFMVYADESLVEPDTTGPRFAATMTDICAMQTVFVEHGIVFWDLGFSTHSNYMKTACGDLRVIDYGGNSFVYINPDDAPAVRHQRPNLIVAKNAFLQAALLLHILGIGFGQKNLLDYPSRIQWGGKRLLERAVLFALSQLKGTSFEAAATAIAGADLLTKEGWQDVGEAFSAIGKDHSCVYEAADISHVEFGADNVVVRGYQNFRITREAVTPLQSEQELWDTRQKHAIVQSAYERIAETGEPIAATLDIGCNSGLYVFLAARIINPARACGVDYNSDYIDLCTRIVDHLSLENHEFFSGSFSELDGGWDVVLAMGLIHHLYHRTEDYGSLEAILRKFAEITNRYLIIEFPMETDPKARKWTSIRGRKSSDPYSLENFLRIAGSLFGSVEKIGEIGPTRPTYLLRKNNKSRT